VAGLTGAFTGPGALSLNVLLGYSMSGALWGAAALFLVGGLLSAVRRALENPPVLLVCSF